MKCIMCGEELRFKAGEAPLYNVDQYGNPANAKTACCSKMLRIFPRGAALILSTCKSSMTLKTIGERIKGNEDGLRCQGSDF